MLSHEIADCCKALKISQNMVENSQKVTADSHQEYLLKLLKLEIEHREKTRQNRLIKNAGFYTMKSLEVFKFDEVTVPASINIDYLRKCEFIKDKSNLVFYGNVGTGKTHLATAIGIEACKLGKSVKFFRTAALVNKLSEAKKAKELSGFIKQIMKNDLLIFDEWGYIPLDRDGSQLLFEIISECYERKSIIITTNIEFSRWTNVLYDEQMTGALIDRLLHHCHLLIFNGESERMKNSLIRQG
ncbi:IS21-like element helper ATPase IstB [Acetivibrio clariflavus]|uniref:DNA replication protein n=3 Tax=Acetivibrio clariflavus TaxID=288965 RepID=G8LZM9_ACECE|nr:IS21-like element helper ATPase IstB [Acetivibrio clariflavus]AEV67930.1 DNA replication protein [Acetivibrio clariflavus DSM 19732]